MDDARGPGGTPVTVPAPTHLPPLEIDGLTGDRDRDSALIMEQLGDLVVRERRDGVDLWREKDAVLAHGVALTDLLRAHNNARGPASVERVAWQRVERMRKATDDAYEALAWPGRGDRWITKHHAWCVHAAALADAVDLWTPRAETLRPLLEPLRTCRTLYAERVPEHLRLDLDIPDPATVRADSEARHERRLRITAQTLGPLSAPQYPAAEG